MEYIIVFLEKYYHYYKHYIAFITIYYIVHLAPHDILVFWSNAYIHSVLAFYIYMCLYRKGYNSTSGWNRGVLSLYCGTVIVDVLATSHGISNLTKKSPQSCQHWKPFSFHVARKLLYWRKIFGLYSGAMYLIHIVLFRGNNKK